MEIIITKQISMSIPVKRLEVDDTAIDNYDIVLDHQLEKLGFSVDHTEIINSEDE